MNFGNCSNWIVAAHSFAVGHLHAHHHFISEYSFGALQSIGLKYTNCNANMVCMSNGSQLDSWKSENKMD